jgi:hypothetical protein
VLSINPETIGNQFNLALTILCQARYQLALKEYERGLEQVKAKPALRRRMLLHVSLGDPGLVEREWQVQSDADEVRKVKELLSEALKEARARLQLSSPSPPPFRLRSKHRDAAVTLAATRRTPCERLSLQQPA